MSDSKEEKVGDVSALFVVGHSELNSPRLSQMLRRALGRRSLNRQCPPCNNPAIAQIPLSLASFSGDLSSMTAPPFILSPVSLTEFPGTVSNYASIDSD